MANDGDLLTQAAADASSIHDSIVAFRDGAYSTFWNQQIATCNDAIAKQQQVITDLQSEGVPAQTALATANQELAQLQALLNTLQGFLPSPATS